MLKKTFLLTAFLLLLAGNSRADFLDDFQSAVKLRKARKYSEAAAAYEKLGREQTKDAGLADLCYVHASEALASGKKLDKALEMAKAIREPGVQEYARMQAYSSSGNSRKIKEVFKDTDISRWPDEYAYLGYYLRGTAAPRAAGIADLEQALARCGSDSQVRDAVRRDLGERYVAAGKNEQAHAVLDQLIATGAKGAAPYLAGVRAKTVLLAKEKKFDEADRMLARIDRKGDWKEKLQHFWFVITKAKIEAEKGNRGEAEKLYDEAFAMDGIALPVIRFQKIEAARKFPKYKEKK
ncbi:MAG: hypothetical protein IJS14_05030 [Lentisphaeria bacterium]|nr:hypothetical protein [Lentisphaeria bacterium]